jgi:NAD(P)-dependent dehydrogenase (short-subunit alcohol dehydrogenase family)
MVAVVTGGATGIGRAIVGRLVDDGFLVAYTYRRTPVEGEARGERMVGIECDVRSRESVDRLARQVLETLGTPDALINNAGVAPHTDFLAITEDEWQDVIDTNVGGTFRVTQAFLPAMLAARSGVIVNLASELAFLGEPELAHYVASKSAIVGFTKSLARAFGPRGIRVNAVAPGPTDTRMLTPGERTAEYVSALPLRRLGTPDEIADTVAFLCSDRAAWYAGQVLSPNGGAVMP